MKRRPQLSSAYLSLACASLVFLGASSFASSLDDGEKELIQARRDYFNAVVDGKVKTNEEKAELYRNTVGAASGKLNQLVVNRWKDAFQRKTSIQQNDPNLTPPADVVQKQLAKIAKTDGKGKPDLEPTEDIASSSGPALSAPVSGSSGATSDGHETTALDGSKVPRLLEFSGNKKKAPAAK